jgi:hypothetical protein
MSQLKPVSSHDGNYLTIRQLSRDPPMHNIGHYRVDRTLLGRLSALLPLRCSILAFFFKDRQGCFQNQIVPLLIER